MFVWYSALRTRHGQDDDNNNMIMPKRDGRLQAYQTVKFCRYTYTLKMIFARQYNRIMCIIMIV